MILSNFKSKKSLFCHFFVENCQKIHIIGYFGCKTSSTFEENSKINTYSLVSHIDHFVALCATGRDASV